MEDSNEAADAIGPVKVTAARAQDGKQTMAGFKAEVRRKADEAVIYDSQEKWGDSGVFPTTANAIKHGKRWLVAEVKRREQVVELRGLREKELPELLHESRKRSRSLEDDRREVTKKIKAEERLREQAEEAARMPVVDLEFRPESQDFEIRAAPLKYLREFGLIDDDAEVEESNEGR